MSIYGIRGPATGATRPEAAGTYGPGGTRPSTGGVARPSTPAPASAPAAASKATAPAAGVPVQPPQGTDPELWGVLTQDERAYFAKLGAMGPLTYGRVLSGQLPASAPIARGARLDVKA